jgi:hypothetical protein
VVPDSQLTILEDLGVGHIADLVRRRIRVTGNIEQRNSQLSIPVMDVASQLEVLMPNGQWERPEGTGMRDEFIQPPISQLRTMVGSNQTVEFRVLGVGGERFRYLNSKFDYKDPNCFTAVIAPDQVPALKTLGIDNMGANLRGKTVRVTGPVEDREGQVRIHVGDLAKQLHIVEPAN